MPLPDFAKDSVAVVTGGAAGIGLAAAARFARLGLRVCIADLGEDRLGQAQAALAEAAPGAEIMVMETDVSRVEDVRSLEQAVLDRFGAVDVLMNNAGVQPGSQMFSPAANCSSSSPIALSASAFDPISNAAARTEVLMLVPRYVTRASFQSAMILCPRLYAAFLSL